MLSADLVASQVRRCPWWDTQVRRTLVEKTTRHKRDRQRAGTTQGSHRPAACFLELVFTSYKGPSWSEGCDYCFLFNR